MKQHLQAIAASLSLVCAAAVAHAAALRSVTINAATMSSGLIKTSVLRLETKHPASAAYGMVIDPSPIITLRYRIVSARAKLTLDEANLARAQKLYRSGGNVSKASLQQIQAKTAIAQARVEELLAQAKMRYGAALGAAIADNGPSFRTISTGGSLVSVVQAVATLVSPPAASARSPDGSRVTLRPVGSAGRIPKGLLGQTFFYTGPALPIGAPLPVTLRAPGVVTGYAVPAAALIWHDNGPFVFVRIGASHFAMYRVTRAYKLRHSGTISGFFVPDADLPAHPAIVTSGVGLLNSALAGGGASAANND